MLGEEKFFTTRCSQAWMCSHTIMELSEIWARTWQSWHWQFVSTKCNMNENRARDHVIGRMHRFLWHLDDGRCVREPNLSVVWIWNGVFWICHDLIETCEMWARSKAGETLYIHKWLSFYFTVYFEGSPPEKNPRALCQGEDPSIFICSHVLIKGEFMCKEISLYLWVLLKLGTPLGSCPQVALP